MNKQSPHSAFGEFMLAAARPVPHDAALGYRCPLTASPGAARSVAPARSLAFHWRLLATWHAYLMSACNACKHLDQLPHPTVL